MTETALINKQVASLADDLSLERDATVQFIIHGARDVDDASLTASYINTDRQLTDVRLQSAWPSGGPQHLASLEAFTVALGSVRNRTRTLARQPQESSVTLASLFTFYVDVNEFLLLSAAKTTQVLASLHRLFFSRIFNVCHKSSV